MKKILLASFFLLPFFGVDAQPVEISSFQHVVRWVYESNFPPFVIHENVSDILVKAAAGEAAKHFNTISVDRLPSIEYRYIRGFGKAEIKNPQSFENDNHYHVAIFSFLTRATTGYKVNWNLKAVASKNGEVVFSHETGHEIECFSATGYLSDMPWFTEESFINLYKDLLAELFDNREPLPAKIIIGSSEQKDKEVREIMVNPVRMKLKSNGNFLGGGNFIMTLVNEDDKDTLVTVNYHDGWRVSSEGINMSEVAASLLSSATGLAIGYNSKSKSISNGRLRYSDGREVRLRTEFVVSTEKYTDGTYGASYPVSPMVAEAFEQNREIAYFTCIPAFALSNQNHDALLKGRFGEHSITAEYNTRQDLIEISEDGQVKVMVVMQNLNPNSNTFSNSRISKNKTFMTQGGSPIGKARFTEPEWYHFYYDPGLSKTEVLQYLDALFIFFFGMGH